MSSQIFLTVGIRGRVEVAVLHTRAARPFRMAALGRDELGAKHRLTFHIHNPITLLVLYRVVYE
jgi:hypothetical protein